MKITHMYGFSENVRYFLFSIISDEFFCFSWIFEISFGICRRIKNKAVMTAAGIRESSAL